MKIRVLHFELDGNIGGIEAFLLNMYKNFNRKTFQFDFVTSSGKPGYGDELKALGANIYQVASYKSPLHNRRDIKNLIKNGNYDIIHFHKNSAANILPILYVKKFFHGPIVVHSHNTKPSESRILLRFLHLFNRHYLSKNANLRLACGTDAGRWLFKNKDFIVVNNGINTSDYLYDCDARSKIRKELNIEDNCFVIGHVGRFTEQKNHEFLIRIFKEIHAQEENSKLVLIGRGELQNQIRKQVNDYRLNDSVIFLNERKDVPSVLSSLDVFLFPSKYEGLSVAAIEAQAAGLTTYMSDGVSKETWVSEAARGFKLTDSPQDIASQIIKDKTMSFNRIVINSQVKKAGYDIKSSADELEALYKKLLER